MGVEVVQNRIHPLTIGRQPSFCLLQEIYPVGNRWPAIAGGQGVAGGRNKRAKNLALAAPSVVGFRFGAFCRLRRLRNGANGLPPRITSRRQRPHCVEADYDAAVGRLGVERFDAPFFSAKSGSTRSPNHVSCVRQRRPSATRSSLTRLRCIEICFSSCR